MGLPEVTNCSTTAEPFLVPGIAVATGICSHPAAESTNSLTSRPTRRRRSSRRRSRRMATMSKHFSSTASPPRQRFDPTLSPKDLDHVLLLSHCILPIVCFKVALFWFFGYFTVFEPTGAFGDFYSNDRVSGIDGGNSPTLRRESVEECQPWSSSSWGAFSLREGPALLFPNDGVQWKFSVATAGRSEESSRPIRQCANSSWE